MRSFVVGTRRRGEELLKAIHEAALEEANTVGYAKTTMEGIAAAAGTGKAALYRRWPDKDALLADALRSVVPSFDDFPLTDDLRADLVAVFTHVRAALLSLKADRYATLKASGGDTLIHEVFIDRVNLPSKRVVLEILRRGAERGDVRPGAVNEMTAAAGYALFIDHCRTYGMKVKDEFITGLVDDVVLPMVRT